MIIAQRILFQIFSPVGQAHIALAQEGVMHGKGCRESMMSVTTERFCILQVVTQQRPVVGVCHLDQLLGPLHVALVTQVGHTILGDDSIDEVIGVIDMTGKGNDA